MTDLLEAQEAQAQPDTIPTIHAHPDEILMGLSRLALTEADPEDGKLLVSLARRTLAGSAVEEHTLALMLSKESGEPVEVPAAVARPNIVGAETIYHLVRARQEAARGLRPHPSNPAKLLIVPL